MNSVLRGKCSSPPCPYGSDPSYAWSPDGQRLAAAANPLHGPTFLKLFNRSGEMVRSFTLPQGHPARSARAFHHLVSWSPDGSRLLLLQTMTTGLRRRSYSTSRRASCGRWPRCISAATRASRGHRTAGLSALTEQRVCQDGPTTFSVIDAASARPIIQCADRPACNGGTVWARDSQSLFGTVINKGASRIERLYLAGRRTTVIKSSASQLTPHIATATGLVYLTTCPKDTLSCTCTTSRPGTVTCSSRRNRPWLSSPSHICRSATHHAVLWTLRSG